MTTVPLARRAGSSRSWPVPAALLALSAVPLTAGALRLVELGGGPVLMPAGERFADLPQLVVLHVLAAAVYVVVGAFQFVPALRRRHLRWHRRAGRVLAAAGLVVAVTAVGMTLLYPAEPGTGDLLFVARLGSAAATAAFLVLGVVAARHGDVPAHRAWMIRAYALALGAGTQVLTEPLGGALLGTGELVGDVTEASAWLVDLAVAEWLVRRPVRLRLRLRLQVSPGGLR